MCCLCYRFVFLLAHWTLETNSFCLFLFLFLFCATIWIACTYVYTIFSFSYSFDRTVDGGVWKVSGRSDGHVVQFHAQTSSTLVPRFDQWLRWFGHSIPWYDVFLFSLLFENTVTSKEYQHCFSLLTLFFCHNLKYEIWSNFARFHNEHTKQKRQKTPMSSVFNSSCVWTQHAISFLVVVLLVHNQSQKLLIVIPEWYNRSFSLSTFMKTLYSISSSYYSNQRKCMKIDVNNDLTI
jgi:hypothetical protein